MSLYLNFHINISINIEGTLRRTALNNLGYVGTNLVTNCPHTTIKWIYHCNHWYRAAWRLTGRHDEGKNFSFYSRVIDCRSQVKTETYAHCLLREQDFHFLKWEEYFKNIFSWIKNQIYDKTLFRFDRGGKRVGVWNQQRYGACI